MDLLAEFFIRGGSFATGYIESDRTIYVAVIYKDIVIDVNVTLEGLFRGSKEVVITLTGILEKLLDSNKKSKVPLPQDDDTLPIPQIDWAGAALFDGTKFKPMNAND